MEKLSVPISIGFNRKVYVFALKHMLIDLEACRQCVADDQRAILAMESEVAQARRVLADMDALEQARPTAADPAPAIAAPPPAEKTAPAATPKRKLTSAGRKAIATAQKTRWAKVRAEKKIEKIRKKL